MGTKPGPRARRVPVWTLCLLLQMAVSSVPGMKMGDIDFQCPHGFQFHESDCYLVVDTAMTHDDAEMTCNSYGASLVEIRDEVESREVGKMVHQQDPSLDLYWIGNLVENETDACAGYWDAQEPKDDMVSSEIYVAARAPHGRWNEETPDTRFPFVCRTEACADGNFRCRDGQKCILSTRTCDGVFDCQDQSDESDCASRCTHYLRGASGALSKNSGYDAGTTCTWVIEGVPGQPLSVKFVSVNVEEDVDYVEVWGGSYSVASSLQLARLTGSLSNRVVYGINHFLIIRLVADATIQKTGFVAEWDTDNELLPVDRPIQATDSWTELTSPHYNSQHPPLAYVRQFTVSTEDGSFITMEVMDNDLDDGFDYDSDTLSRINGGNLMPATYVSTSNTFTFVLSSSRDSEPKQFRARVKKGCAVDVTGTNGFIFPPNSEDPIRYPSSITCDYVAHAPSDAQRPFQLYFTAKQLADATDTVKVFDGPSNTSQMLDVEMTPVAIDSTSSTVFVRFESGLVQTEGFFNLTFNLACPAITNVDNMMLSNNDTHYGSEVTLTCDTGFAFEQEEFVSETEVTVSCGMEGKWNVSRLPTCAGIYCGVPSPIDNGFIVNGSGTAQYGATVTYQCYEGFSLQGTATVRTCGAGSSWTAEPVCQALQCPPLGGLANGNLTTVNGSGTDFGTVVQFTCDPGYDLIGASLTLCQRDGLWSHTHLVCQKIRCPIPEVHDLAAVSSIEPVPFEGLLTVTCDDGFVINGTSGNSQVYDCPSSGDFGISYDVCVDFDECSQNDTCTGDNEKCENTVGNYTCICEDMYQRDGAECKVIDRCVEGSSGCDLVNGNCTSINEGKDYMCGCNVGYVLFTEDGLNGFNIPSLEDGNTAEDVYHINHTCVPKICGRPPNITNGQALTIKTTFEYNETVEYRCDFGYRMAATSSAVLTCSGDDTWDKSPPTCLNMTCEPLTATGLVLNIYPNSTTFPEEMVLLECVSESTGVPYNKTLFCAYDRQNDTFRLQGDSPHCPAVDCGSLVPSGGQDFIPPSTTGLGSSFEFGCIPAFSKEGVSIHGNDTVTCEKNGRWGFANLTCIGGRCTDPGTPAGMTQSYTHYDVESMVTYQCLKAGFMPRPSSRTCLFDSATNTTFWNGTEPVCEDVERPEFENCPMEPIHLNIYSNPRIDTPTVSARDNSGLVKVTVSPKWAKGDVALDYGVYNLTYTATDSANLLTTCNVTLEVNDVVTVPELACPEYLTLDVNNTEEYNVNLTDIVNTDSDYMLSFEPGSTVTVDPSKVGQTVYRVTATNSFGFQRQCAFIVEIKPNACLQTYISENISQKNAQVNCNDPGDGTLNCIVTCNSGFAFQTGSASMAYVCQGTNEWTPPLPTRTCVAIQDVGHLYVVDVKYESDRIEIGRCQDSLTEKLKEVIPTRNVFGCTENGNPLNFHDPAVEFPFTISIMEMTARISLSVQNNVSFSSDKCDLLLENKDNLTDLFDVSEFSLDCDGDGTSHTLTVMDRKLEEGTPVCPDSLVMVATADFPLKCVACEPGFYFNNSQCNPCDPGEFQDLVGQTSCKKCDYDGQFSKEPRVSSSQCVAPCFLGFYNNESQTAEPSPCHACPEDTYLDAFYSPQCTQCPSNKTTFGVEGAEQCKDKCKKGQYPVNNTECADCPQGYYKDTAGNTACTACDMGQTTNAAGATNAGDCVPVTELVCMNGGVPQVDYHISFCDCPDGYSGETCQDVDDACKSSPCFNGGTCTPTSTPPDFYTCTCRSSDCILVSQDLQYDFNKQYRSTQTNETDCRQQCLDESQCAAILFFETPGLCSFYDEESYVNGTENGFIKFCPDADLFNGSRCENDLLDNCTSDTCHEESFCRDLIDDAECVCPRESKYSGPRCEPQLDLCSTNPCENGATCLDSGSGVRVTCVCPPGYTGDKCEEDINECDENPDGCLHVGTCVDGINEYTCNCSHDYSGDHCETKPDFCSDGDICAKGLCYNDYETSSAVCVCEFPYRDGMGSACKAISICTEDTPCQHNANCTDGEPGSYTCSCPSGYQGSLCQHDTDDCSANPCVNGTCTDKINDYNCTCDPGYEGENCDMEINDCLGDPCGSNSSKCHDLLLSFSCTCKPGFTGKQCETNINECQSLPCKHGGTCEESDVPGEYTCHCPGNWKGQDCEEPMDFCDPDPCNNGGACVSLQDDFFCRCLSGTFGKTCENATKVCAILDPCTSESSCQNKEGTAYCDCPTYYTGSSCNLIEDSCSRDPCENEAMCITHALGYTCQCAEGYTGENCTTQISPCGASCPDDDDFDCIVQDDEPMCLCTAVGKLKSGSTCKEMSSDFDIYFTKPGKAIRSYQPFTLDTSSLSVVFWVAPLKDTTDAVVELKYSDNETVLAFDMANVTFGSESPMKMNEINAVDVKKWNQVAVSWSKNDTTFISLNGVRRIVATTPAAFPLLNKPIFIYIGGGFVGYISQLYVWQTELSFDNILAMYDQPKMPTDASLLVAKWSAYRVSDNLWSRIVSPSIVEDTFCSGDVCLIRDEAPPAIPGCPVTDVLFDVERVAQISDEVPGMNFSAFTTNLNSTVLALGKYRVVFMSKNDENVAFCRFNAYVKRKGQSCSNTEGLVDVASCGDGGQRVQCPDNGTAPLSPKILTCGMLGSYNLDASHKLPNAVVCGSTEARHFMVTLTLPYEMGVTCDIDKEEEIQNKLTAKVKDLKTDWAELCPDSDCSSVTVSAKCDSSNTKKVTATITLDGVPATLTHKTTNVTLTARELLQAAALEFRSFEITDTYNSQLSEDSVVTVAEPSCKTGFGLFGDVCVECTEGSFLNETTKMCELCPIGSYTDASKQTMCKSCGDETTLQLGASSCAKKCDPGHFLNQTDGQCQQCHKNFYQNESGQIDCLPCPGGSVTEERGAVSEDSCYATCDAGTELKNGTCEPCERGFFRQGIIDGNDECEACPANLTTSGLGSTSETQCNEIACRPGYFRNSTTEECLKCDYGYFQPKKWQNSCEKCNDSYTTHSTGSTTAVQCVFYCKDPGHEVLSAENETCRACPRGYFFNTTEENKKIGLCSKCSTNTTDSEASVSEDLCNVPVCEAGEEVSGGGCVGCPKDTYQPEKEPRTTDKCKDCTQGTGTKAPNQTSESACLNVCDPGQQYDEEKGQCEACPMGTWNSGNDSQRFEQCAPCPADYVTINEMMGANSSDQCTLKNCSIGEYIGENDTCTPCPVGYYQDEYRKDGCKKCPQNTNTSGDGHDAESDCTIYCPAGRKSSSDNVECQLCPEDTFKESPGFGDCEPCEGNYTSNENRTDCDILYCDVGYEFGGNSMCLPCPVGKYKDIRGNASCTDCPTNTTTAGRASTSGGDCVKANCDKGFYSMDGNLPCKACPVGEYKDDVGNHNCTPCDLNLNTEGNASTDVKDCSVVFCDKGYQLNGSSCTPCEAGTYKEERGNSVKCTACPTNTTTSGQAFTSQSDCNKANCDKGYYSSDGSLPCLPCAEGQYKNTTGNQACTPCESGSTTAGVASTDAADCSLADCQPGSYRVTGHSCRECPCGTFQPLKNQKGCQDCPSSTTTLNPGRSSNHSCYTACGEGEEYDSGNSVCRDCVLHYFRSGASCETPTCVKCPYGQTTLGEGASTCVDSVPGGAVQVVRQIQITVRIVLKILSCANTNQIEFAIRLAINNVFNRLSTRYQNLCRNQCSNVGLRFGGSCLIGFLRRKRTTETTEHVDVTVKNVSEEVQDGNGNIQQTPTVVSNALYDTLPDENVLGDNGIRLDGMDNLTVTFLCEPGQYSQDSDCKTCGTGTFSADGLVCSPCAQNFYQNSTGQAECLPCPDKTFTSSTGSTHASNCSRKCDEPNARETYCSGHGACVFDANIIDGVRCECDDKYTGADCVTREDHSDDKTAMIGAIVGGAAAFLLLVLLVVGVIACLRRAAKKGKKKPVNGNGAAGSRGTSNLAYMDDRTSERYQDYNFPLYDNGVRGHTSRPAIMYMNPVAEPDMADFYVPDKHSYSTSRPRSYEGEWRDFEGTI